MVELRHGNDTIRDDAGSAQPGPDLPVPAPPADRPGLEHRSAPDRGWLSDSYRDDPDDIFGGEHWDSTQDHAADTNEGRDTDEASATGEAVEADSADGAGPESLVHRPDLPGGVAVHYGVDFSRRDGQLVRPEVFDGPPTRDQAVQGRIGDCGVIAALGAVAGHRPEAIEDLIETRGDGSHLVRLHDARRTGPGSWEPTSRRIDLTVTPDLPVLDATPHRAAFANTHDTGVGWAALLEKALAGVDTTWTAERSETAGHRGYDRLNRGTYPTDQAELLTQLTGRPAAAHRVDATPGNEPAVEEWLRDRLNADSPVLVGTNDGDRYGRLPNELVRRHAYEVVLARDGRITLHNPWGNRHPAPMDIREFLDSIVPFISSLDEKENR